MQALDANQIEDSERKRLLYRVAIEVVMPQILRIALREHECGRGDARDSDTMLFRSEEDC